LFKESMMKLLTLSAIVLALATSAAQARDDDDDKDSEPRDRGCCHDPPFFSWRPNPLKASRCSSSSAISMHVVWPCRRPEAAVRGPLR
jgi:hypothetical protein